MEKKNKNNSTEKDRRPTDEPFLKKGLDAFGNMFALNICFVIGCLPIFTIGASLTALYAMSIRLQEEEEETVVAGFIHEYKRNFKQATKAFLLVLLALFVMGGEYVFIKSTSGAIASFYKGVLVTEVILFALTIFFLFPLIARYENSLFVTIRNSLVLSVTYLGSWIKVAVAWVAPIAFCVIYPEFFLFLWYLWLLIIFGAIGYGTSATMRKIFNLNTDRMEEAERKAREEEDEDDDESEDDAGDESEEQSEDESDDESDIEKNETSDDEKTASDEEADRDE